MSGPVKRGGIKFEVDDDGRNVFTFRQSTLSELDECSERGRLVLTGQMPRIETDAACLGTAVHYGIEGMLGEFWSTDYAVQHAQVHFDLLSVADNFEWVKYGPRGRDLIHTAIDRCVRTFAKEVLPKLNPIAIEIPFERVFLYEDDERVIYLNGTIDYFDAYLGGIDWKTSGDTRKYQAGFGGEAWKLDRWNIQSSVYTLALVELGFLDPEGPWPFTFAAFTVPSGVYQEHTVARTVGDHDWLRAKCVAWAKLIEAEVSTWPMTDNQALCSPKWCPAWGQCKGKHVDESWPLKAKDVFPVLHTP